MYGQEFEIENETRDSPTTNPKSFNTIKMSILWLLCFVGYLAYLYFGLGVDLLVKIAYETYQSDLKFGGSRSCCWGDPWRIMKIGISIGPISTLGLPMLAVSFLGVSVYIILLTMHGFGSLLHIQLQQTKSSLSKFLVVGFHVLIAAGFVGILLSSRRQKPCRSTTGNRERPEHFLSIHDAIVDASPCCFQNSRG